MSTPPMPRQYLEGFDSVRTARPSLSGGTADDATEANLLQVLLEVVATLAMGRDIVVPQTYAFDSWAFLHTADLAWRARSKAGSKERPIKVHLFGEGIGTFRDAVARMVMRVHDPSNPFVSSLLPALSDLQADEVTLLARNPHELWAWADAGGDDLARLLEQVDEEFRTSVPTRASRARSGTPSLGQLISSAGLSLSSPVPGRDDETTATLHAGLVALDASRPEAFLQRSRLRHTAPWPNDPQGRPPEQIVGPRALDLLIEFVDTLYNRVVANSIDNVDASFVTAVDRDGAHQHARSVAQTLALRQVEPSGDAPLEGSPVFELRSAAPDATTGHGTDASIRHLESNAAVVLERVFALRDENGGRAAGRSPFWRGLAAVREAEDETAARSALDRHLQLVSSAAGGNAEMHMSASKIVELTLTGAGSAAPAYAVAAWGIGAAWGAALGAAGALAPSAVSIARGEVRRRKGTRLLATALGSMVSIQRGPL